MISAGTGFFWNADSHLRFVISDPSQDPLHVVHVNVTTYRPRFENPIAAMKDAINDPACILAKNEHSFLTAEESCIYYVGARQSTLAEIEEKINKGVWRVHPEPASKVMLCKMREGATKTAHLEECHEDVLKQQGLHPFYCN